MKRSTVHLTEAKTTKIEQASKQTNLGDFLEKRDTANEVVDLASYSLGLSPPFGYPSFILSRFWVHTWARMHSWNQSMG